jgi:hypothetical protein
MSESAPRHRLFATAQLRGELSLYQLWLRYLGLTGDHEMIDIDAFMHGLTDLPAIEQDKLAHALNESLDDIHLASRVPYLAPELSAEHSYEPTASPVEQSAGSPPTRLALPR